jgi:uncharacterized repeat protein (TIGR03847 family)
VELDPVDRITTDAIGEPGERVFYLQARQGTMLVTVLVEKQQVQLLAASILEILSRVGKETGQGPGEEEMGLEEPIEPVWRAGRLSIGYLEERDLILLELEELLPEAEDDEDEDEDAAETEGEVEADPSASAAIEEAESVLSALEELEELSARPGEKEAGRIRLWATREQMLSLSRHGTAVCSRGRPPCQFCGNPLDPEGHICPAMNGHGRSGQP